jgi:hypothetical protein
LDWALAAAHKTVRQSVTKHNLFNILSIVFSINVAAAGQLWKDCVRRAHLTSPSDINEVKRCLSTAFLKEVMPVEIGDLEFSL